MLFNKDLTLRSITWKGPTKVHIRNSNGEVYDVSSDTFKAETLATNPFIDVPAGTGLMSTVLYRAFALTPAFTDGYYEVFYHDWVSADHAIFKVEQVCVQDMKVVEFLSARVEEVARELAKAVPRTPIVS